eukprot:8533506-Pyramimonas_sp.AAC.1
MSACHSADDVGPTAMGGQSRGLGEGRSRVQGPSRGSGGQAHDRRESTRRDAADAPDCPEYSASIPAHIPEYPAS